MINDSTLIAAVNITNLFKYELISETCDTLRYLYTEKILSSHIFIIIPRTQSNILIKDYLSHMTGDDRHNFFVFMCDILRIFGDNTAFLLFYPFNKIAARVDRMMTT